MKRTFNFIHVRAYVNIWRRFLKCPFRIVQTLYKNWLYRCRDLGSSCETIWWYFCDYRDDSFICLLLMFVYLSFKICLFFVFMHYSFNLCDNILFYTGTNRNQTLDSIAKAFWHHTSWQGILWSWCRLQGMPFWCLNFYRYVSVYHMPSLWYVYNFPYDFAIFNGIS